jgi:hypothetical protein
MELCTMESKKRLDKIILPIILFVSLVPLSRAEPAANKPYKVCPLVVTVKDVPCRVPKPTAAITHRLEIPVTNDIKQLEEENKMLRKIIEELTDAKSTN